MIPYHQKVGIEEITDLSFHIPDKLINEFNPFVDKLNFYKLSNIINFRVNIRLKSMLNI